MSTIAERGRAVADPTRVRILEVLARGPHAVGEIAATLACEPSMISKHLQVLFHARLVGRRRSASAVIYSLVDAEVAAWIRYLSLPQVGRGGR